MTTEFAEVRCLDNFAFADSKALVKMQDSLRESKREMERLKERNATLENMKRTMEADIREMQR